MTGARVTLTSHLSIIIIMIIVIIIIILAPVLDHTDPGLCLHTPGSRADLRLPEGAALILNVLQSSIHRQQTMFTITGVFHHDHVLPGVIR